MDLGNMTPEELNELMEKLRQEMIKRQNLQLYQSRQTQLQEEFRSADMLPKAQEDQPWKRPTESVLAYGLGDTVVAPGGERRTATAGIVVCDPSCNDHWEDAE